MDVTCSCGGVTLDRRTVQVTIGVTRRLIRSLENDSNKFRREVAAVHQIPALQALIAELEEALSA